MNVHLEHRIERDRLIADIPFCPNCGYACNVCQTNESCCLVAESLGSERTVGSDP